MFDICIAYFSKRINKKRGKQTRNYGQEGSHTRCFHLYLSVDEQVIPMSSPLEFKPDSRGGESQL